MRFFYLKLNTQRSVRALTHVILKQALTVAVTGQTLLCTSDLANGTASEWTVQRVLGIMGRQHGTGT